MTDCKRPPFGLRRDGSIDRRDFLRTAGRLGVGAFGLSMGSTKAVHPAAMATAKQTAVTAT